MINNLHVEGIKKGKKLKAILYQKNGVIIDEKVIDLKKLGFKPKKSFQKIDKEIKVLGNELEINHIKKSNNKILIGHKNEQTEQTTFKIEIDISNYTKK